MTDPSPSAPSTEQPTAEALLAALQARNPRWAEFCRQYVADENLSAPAAYLAAGYKATGAALRVNASKLRAKPEVEEVIAALMRERGERTGITADAVLERWWAIATADPNELIELRRVCCRYCYGEGHRYQRTPREEAQAVATRDAGGTYEPMGGVGYDRRKPPHPDCPECHGDGVEEVFAKDTRRLSPTARLLYAGVKQTKEGLEVKMRSQDGALENVARHLGMLTQRHEHTGKDGEPIAVRHTIAFGGMEVEF